MYYYYLNERAAQIYAGVCKIFAKNVQKFTDFQAS